MASVQLTATAQERLGRLLKTRDLPSYARARVVRRLKQLETFPEAGRRIEVGPWQDARVVTGPWWFVLVYVYDQSTETVSVTTIEDVRTATGTTAR